VCGTDALGQLLRSQPTISPTGFVIATLGRSELPKKYDDIHFKTEEVGADIATAIATGIGATIMHYIRVVGKGTQMQLRDRWDMTQILQLPGMSSPVDGSYVLTPWEFWQKDKRLVDLTFEDALT
jgi:hypothetical protein